MSCRERKSQRDKDSEKCGLRLVAYLPPWTMILFRPKLRPRTMSVLVALLQLWSVLMSLAPNTTEGC